MLPPNPAPSEPQRADGHVDQIRDILFGGQMREYDHRFAQLERQTAGELERLRQELEERVRAAQEQSNTALRQLAEQLQAERAARVGETQSAAQAVHVAFENLSRELRESGERQEARLREHAGQNQAALDAAKQEREALAVKVDEQFKQLSAVVAERGTLSDLFTEMAGRLGPKTGPSAA